jgi:hypothetical protein
MLDAVYGTNAFSFTTSTRYDIQDTRTRPPEDDNFRTTDADLAAGYKVLFNLDESQTYKLTRTRDVVINDPKGMDERFFRFTNDGFNGVEISDTEGTLPAGQYGLVFDIDMNATIGTPDARTFQVDTELALTFSPVDNGPPGGNAIPLPPAAWSGLSVLGAGGVLSLLRKRRIAGLA